MIFVKIYCMYQLDMVRLNMNFALIHSSLLWFFSEDEEILLSMSKKYFCNQLTTSNVWSVPTTEETSAKHLKKEKCDVTSKKPLLRAIFTLLIENIFQTNIHCTFLYWTSNVKIELPIHVSENYPTVLKLTVPMLNNLFRNSFNLRLLNN